MVMWARELVLFVCVILFGVLAIERVAKPVVFSYSSADLPLAATISHHYKGPVSSSVEQQFTPASTKYRIHNKQKQEDFYPGRGSYQSTPAYYDGRTSENHQPHATASSPSYDEPQGDYDYVTVNPKEHYMTTTLAYYDERSVNGNKYYHSPSGGKSGDNHQPSYVYPTARPSHSGNHHLNDMLSTSASSVNHQDYDFSTSPKYFQSTTASYYDDPEVDNSRHNANPTSTVNPVYENIKQGYKFAVINPDNSYHSTTVTYYSRLPSESYGVPPSSSSHDNQNLDYDNDTTSFMPNGDQDHHYIPEIYSPSPTTIQHDYTKVSVPSNKSVPNEFIQTDDSSVATTQVANSFALYPIQKTSYLDQPETLQLTEHESPRTSRRRIYSSTTNYYEDNDELISTTPIAEFESVRKKLPSIDDYPPPNPGYISETFKNRVSNWRNPNNNDQRATDNNGIKKVSLGDKVLQQPKFFAYSSDLVDDQTGESEKGGMDFHGEQASPQELLLQDYHNQNRDEHEHHDRDDHGSDYHDDDHHKRKEERYSKGGGQEHHAAHKASGGDKGDKGYKSIHEYSSGKKGHHDKEDHKGKYVDEKGKKGKKKEEGGHYGEHHQAENGKKAAKYGESGEHKKGHSTKGEHNIHKKDEYMKKHEFYDEHHEGGDHEKFGGFMAAHAHKNGAKKKKGHQKSSSSHHHRGKKGHHEKGKKEDHEKGHTDAKGFDGHFAHHKKYGKKGGHKEGKKWGYSKGHPK